MEEKKKEEKLKKRKEEEEEEAKQGSSDSDDGGIADALSDAGSVIEDVLEDVVEEIEDAVLWFRRWLKIAAAIFYGGAAVLALILLIQMGYSAPTGCLEDGKLGASAIDGCKLWASPVLGNLFTKQCSCVVFHVQPNSETSTADLAAVMTDLEKTSRKHLHILSAEQTGVEAIPDSISSFTTLRLLLMRSNKLNAVPAGVFKIPTLFTVMLGRNNITALPNNIGDAKVLNMLQLQHNKLRQVPTSLCTLPAIKKLWLQYNLIESVPDDCTKRWQSVPYVQVWGGNPFCNTSTAEWCKDPTGSMEGGEACYSAGCPLYRVGDGHCDVRGEYCGISECNFDKADC